MINPSHSCFLAFPASPFHKPAFCYLQLPFPAFSYFSFSETCFLRHPFPVPRNLFPDISHLLIYKTVSCHFPFLILEDMYSRIVLNLIDSGFLAFANKTASCPFPFLILEDMYSRIILNLIESRSLALASNYSSIPLL